MVLEYAKSLASKAKSKVSETSDYVKNLGSTLRRNSKSEMEEIEELADGVYDYEDKINTNLSKMSSEFASKRQRAERELSEIDYDTVSISSIGIRDPYVDLRGSDTSMSGLFGSQNDRIDLGSDNLEEYLDDLSMELRERDQELERCEDWIGRAGDKKLGEMLDPSAVGEESYPVSLAKSTQVKTILKERKNQLENEKNAIGYEIVDTVDQYTDKLYEEAVAITEKLGGTKRSNKGEFDILRELSEARGEVVSKRSETMNRSSVMRESEAALKSQSNLVDRYLEGLESRRQGIEDLYEVASRTVDDKMLDSIQERLDSINQGVYDLADVVNGNEYDSVQEALEDTVGPAMVDLDMNYSKKDEQMARGV